jgi:PAS domain S-box-containing protein
LSRIGADWGRRSVAAALKKAVLVEEAPMPNSSRGGPDGPGEGGEQAADGRERAPGPTGGEPRMVDAAILERITDAFVALDREWRFIYVNRMAEKAIGLPREELLGRNMWELFPDLAGTQFEAEYRGAVSEGRVRHFQEYYRRLDAWFEKHLYPSEDGLTVFFRDVTERRRTEAELRESEEMHRLLFERNPLPLWVYDVETLRFLAVNESAARRYGYSREEFLSMTIRDIRPPEDVPALMEDVASAPVGYGGPSPWRHLTKDGSVIDVEITSYPLTFGGRPARFVLANDVTERHRAERALLGSEARLAGIVESAMDAIITIDEQQRVVLFNAAAEEMFGLTASEALGRPLDDFIPRRYRAAHREYIRDFGTTGVTSRVMAGARAVSALRADGVEFLVEASISQIEASGQKLYTVIMRDITERREAEERLIRISRAVEGTSDGIRITDLAGNSIYHNPAFLRLVGYTVEELNAAGGLNAFMADEALAREMHGTIASGRSWRGEAELKSRDGRAVFVHVSADAIKDDSGSIIGLMCIYTDITERRQMEVQFRQAQKMEAVGRLAGGIAHDFNNLLTAITGYSDLVVDSLSPSDPVRRDVEEIRKAGERASTLTRQLLVFSRQQVLQPKVVDLNALVIGIEHLLRRLIGEDIELSTALDPDLTSVKADPGHIEQVIMNLAVNARDAMPRGGRLTIETKNVRLDEQYAREHGRVVTPGPYVLLAVSDTGVGIDEITLQRIFEPFFTTKEQGKGTGLGLSTVYGIVKQSGGHVWVYSEKGRGATFKVYLPPAGARAEAEEAEEPAKAERGTGTLLLVEDEEMIRKLARKVLEGGGYTVLEAANGLEALRAAEAYEGPIHLLVTDVVMPQMGGGDLVERVTPLRPGMRVLYMSGYTDAAIVHHGVLDEGTNFIQKPFTPDALLRKVREVLEA